MNRVSPSRNEAESPSSDRSRRSRYSSEVVLRCPMANVTRLGELEEESSSSATRRARRGPVRVAVRLPVIVEHATETVRAVAIDVGLGGMFVEASSLLAYGVRVDILVELPGAPLKARLPGLVRWSNERGFGVQFLQLGARETHAISALMDSVKKQDITR